MPTLRLAGFIFLTLLLASLSALASGPTVVTKSQQIQQSPASVTTFGGESGSPAAVDTSVASDSAAESHQSVLATRTIPSVGENIP
jgi:hypothetical protein